MFLEMNFLQLLFGLGLLAIGTTLLVTNGRIYRALDAQTKGKICKVIFGHRSMVV